jgi:hypothetical protein
MKPSAVVLQTYGCEDQQLAANDGTNDNVSGTRKAKQNPNASGRSR